MAIATDIEVTWNGTVDSTNKIGLSKPFTELSSDVWADDSAFITAYTNPAAKFTKVSDGYPTCPVKSNDCPWYLTGGIGYSNTNHNSDSIYLRSAIICIPDDFVYSTWNGNQGGRIRDNINNFRIVTSMSTEKNGVDVSLTVQDGTVVGAQYVLKETLTGSSSNGGITIGAGTYVLMIVDIYTVEGNYYLNIPYSLPGFVYDTNNGDGVMGMWAYDSSVNKMFSLSPQIFPTDDGRISITGGAVYNVNTWNRHELPAVDGDENLIFCASYIPWNWYLSLSGNVHYHLLAVSRFGLKFKYNNENYKPIISQGVVTGYTTDMTVPSDIDNWSDISGHNISPVPPVPPAPTGDNIDDMNMNALWAMSSDAGFARYFLLSHDQLASLMTWLSDTTFPDGYDPYAYILSLLQFPLKLTPLWCMPRTPAGHIVIRGEDTGITASLISNEKAWVGAGTYDVPQLNGNFLDYDPYTQYELYIPCCGWVSLPDIVCGRKIAVKINYDLTTAAIIGNVYVTIDGKEMIVASKSGMMGRETIVTGEAQGVRSAQITSALLSAGTGALNVATGAISGNAVAAVSGGYNIVAGLAQANIAANSAYTRTIGSTGGRALLCQFDQCYLKICTTRADIPNNYGHTCGYVCNVSGKVSAFTGYTVFDNVDVSGIGKATDREKKLIKQILESGVIINPSEE